MEKIIEDWLGSAANAPGGAGRGQRGGANYGRRRGEQILVLVAFVGPAFRRINPCFRFVVALRL